jgi:hypothetical protein
MQATVRIGIVAMLLTVSWTTLALAAPPTIPEPSTQPLPPPLPPALPTVPGLNADYLDDLSAADFAVAGHNHDGRYYTKSESDTRFVGWSKVTSCGFTDKGYSVSPIWNDISWTAAQCSNGLPSGACVGALTTLVSGSLADDFQVLGPGETSWNGFTFSNGGIEFYNSLASIGLAVRALYVCA